MSIIRAILNNGFFIIVLIVAATLYLAYSDSIKKDHGLLEEHAKSSTPNDVTKTPEKDVPATAAVSEEIEEPITEKEQQESVALVSTQPELEEKSTKPEIENTGSDIEDSDKTPLIADAAIAEQVSEAELTSSPAQTTETNATKEIANETTQEKIAEQSNSEADVASNPVLSSELDQILSTPAEGSTQPAFKTKAEALNAANKAMQQQDFKTAASIYSDLNTEEPSANMSGQLAKALYLSGEQEQAEQAWLASAKLLVKDNRLPEASMLASRLMPIAPKTANEIQGNIYNIRQQQMAKMKPQNMQPIQPIQGMPPMPPQNMTPMKPMQGMPPMPPQNMAPIQPMQGMPSMPPQNMAPMKPMQGMPTMPSQNIAPMQPMQGMPPMPPQNMAPIKPMQGMPPMPPQNMAPMQPMQGMPPMPPQNMAPIKPMQNMPPMPPQNMAPMPTPENMSFYRPNRNQYVRYYPRPMMHQPNWVRPPHVPKQYQPVFKKVRNKALASRSWPQQTPWQRSY